jgi:hypothetical protein
METVAILRRHLIERIPVSVRRTRLGKNFRDVLEFGSYADRLVAGHPTMSIEKCVPLPGPFGSRAHRPAASTRSRPN